ncbi:MAG: DUF3307 domain-containing protein, partial [Sedimentisphaerales bacterium]|nr:DUF3307 domain-containing protein [Sedimentisphaerales bacterium]
MSNAIIMFIYLYLGHLIGDILLQSKHLARSKGQEFGSQILHSVVSTLGSVVCYWVCDPGFWLVYFALFVGHVFIDEVKCKLDKYNSSLQLMIIDQVVHLVFIGLLCIAIWYQNIIKPDFGYSPFFESLSSQVAVNIALIVSGGILTVQFGSNLIQKALSKYVDRGEEVAGEVSLSKGGKLTGQLERSIAYLLIISGNTVVVGLVIIAKSILRFNEIKDTKQAEYNIIGSLMSFG